MLTAEKRGVDAQVFFGDALVAIMIFLLAVVAFFSLSPNASSSESRVQDALVADAESISASLMTAGSPAGWTPDNVSTIGLTDGSYRVNYSKVSMFYNISPNLTYSLFGTNANYLIFFKDNNESALAFGSCAFSNANVSFLNVSPQKCKNPILPDPDNLISIERLAFYNLQIVKLVVYVWV